VGTNPNALLRADWHTLEWADEIVCMEQEHADDLLEEFKEQVDVEEIRNKMIILEVPDVFRWMEPDLVHSIKTRYENAQRQLHSEDG
jgi:predicted protein tyrosine phosphatase